MISKFLIIDEIFTFPSFFLLIFLHVPYDPDPMVPMTSKSSNVLGILGLKQPKKGKVSFTKTKAKCLSKLAYACTMNLMI